MTSPLPTLHSVLLVAVGSAVGGAARLLLVSLIGARVTTAFPLGILLVNVIGSFVFGVAIRYGVQSGAMSDAARLLITTGLCGGFTTFSAFTMDIVEGFETGRTNMVTGYIMASLVLGVLGLLSGMAVARALGK